MRKKIINLTSEKGIIGPALLWKRIAAFFVDILIINIVIFWPFKNLLKKFISGDVQSFTATYNFLMQDPELAKTITTISIIMAILVIAYFTLMEWKIGQTIGKILFNIKVVSENNKLSLWQCFIRNIIFIPIFPFFLLWIIDPLFMIFTKKNQRLCEIMSKTRVVEEFVMR